MKSWFPMLTLGVLFFIFGFITWLNGALIPFLQIISDLSEFQALLIAFSFYIAYVVMALPMSWLLDKTGYQQGIVIGLGLIAVGLLLFVPAAQTQWFAIFLTAQFVVGSGLTILQTASNPYITRLGPEQSAAARIAVMGILNKCAGVLAPLFFTWLVLADLPQISQSMLASLPAPERAEQVELMASQLITPYVGMALFLMVVAALFATIKLPPVEEQAPSHNAQSIWQFPQLILGAVALFFYVGVEVIAGDTIGMYGAQLGLSNYSVLTSYVMVAMVLGYLLGLLLIPRWLSQVAALRWSAALGLLLTTLLLFSSASDHSVAELMWGWSGIPTTPNSITFLALLGFANAMVWPTIWPLALAGLGSFTARGSAILIMGIAGGALLPLLYGWLAQQSSMQSAYALLLVGYAVIGSYAWRGYNRRHW
ncbi:sugar MFS transporter [Pseudidiomarina mangrovi]|uniref:sugar MFS transporter n=1 Tax=Pseudidiomarina mangrovi TaxID=2487133 RepID=UPI000FCAE0F5|nr:sugar MFS transporter [Pseudidiomarina mangrovi]